MRSPAARWLPILVLLAALAVGGAAGPATAVPTADGEAPPTTMRIVIGPDGDARWTVTARFTLDSANETRGFDRLATNFERGDADVLSADPFRAAADRAERATGRTMDVQNVTRRGVRADGVGRLSVSFRWTAFARATGDRIAFGDAFRTPSGTWLPRLAPNQELVVVFPDGYAPVSTSHQLTNGTFRIDGPTTFEPGEPSATLVRQAAASETTRSPGGGTDSLTPTGPPVDALTRTAGIGAVLVAAIALAVLAYRRRDSLPTTDDDGAPAAGEPTDGDGPPPDGEPAAGDGEAPLLSDEERVLRLLEANGGRMKQAAIVTETDWSNAKVSQLLSEMDERGEIDKLRIGRENLISLPDETPEEFE